MKSKGCGSLHESQTLEGRLKKNFGKVYRIGGSFAELLAVIQQATFCWPMPIKKQALFFFLIEIRPVSDHQIYGIIFR
jgi:hypothetical protein